MRDKHHAADRFLGANLLFGAYDLSRTPSQRGVGVAPGTDILDGTGFPLDLFLPGMSEAERRDPDISPLYADLSGLPPALFSVGTNDHLLDDSLFMAARWEVAGNRSELLVYPDTPHGCIALPSVAAHFFPRLFDFLNRSLKIRKSQPQLMKLSTRLASSLCRLRKSQVVMSEGRSVLPRVVPRSWNLPTANWSTIAVEVPKTTAAGWRIDAI